MGEYVPVPVRRLPGLGRELTPEARFWRKFKATVTLKHLATTTIIALAPQQFAVNASMHVTVYDLPSCREARTLNCFKSPVHSLSFRNDGQLLAAGDDVGDVHLLQPTKRTALAIMKGGHSRAVHAMAWAGDSKQHLASGADDGVIAIWDIGARAVRTTLSGHTDRVRALAGYEAESALLASCGHDHTARLWDARSGKCVLTLSHAQPVESVLVLPGGALVATAAGNGVYVWDLVSGGRALASTVNHAKTVTSLFLAASGRSLVSAGLDGQIKVYDVGAFGVQASLRLGSPCLAAALVGDTHLLTAHADTTVVVRKRSKATGDLGAASVLPQSSGLTAGANERLAGFGGVPGMVVEPQARAEQHLGTNPGTYRYFLRGGRHLPSQGDFVVSARRKTQFAPYDRSLRKFRYKEALDEALKSHEPAIVAAVVEDLVQRGGLRAALASRDELSLEPVLRFLARHIANPNMSRTCARMANLLLELYDESAWGSELNSNLLLRLRQVIEQELTSQQALTKLAGTIEAIVANIIQV
ncbi:WD40-repeat-containing domain protein [Pavlovales sp. CCMP2436]|nr:WD40-repeat-containing domain protein [Pavlovales sp. CCMP2436]